MKTKTCLSNNTVKNILANGNRLGGKIGIYEMPEYTATEIDEPDDWTILESLMYRHVLKNAFVPLAQYLPYSILLTVGGSLLVERIDGDVYNGMGLPILRLSNMLAQFGVRLL